MERVVAILRDLEAIPSPSGLTAEVIAHIAGICKKAGIKAAVTNKGCLLAGNHPRPDLVVTAHVDTLGAMVRGINADGHLSFTPIGGPVWPSFEGEYVTVIAAGGKTQRGTLLLNNPSAHVNREAGKAERKPDDMFVRLDAEVAKKEDTAKLGIGVGDYIVFDPRFERTATGFIKSRFLDDKAGAACALEAMLALGMSALRKLPVCFFFSTYETNDGRPGEVGLAPTHQGEIFVIDVNAWPSFALFRPVAAANIAALLAARFSRVGVSR